MSYHKVSVCSSGVGLGSNPWAALALIVFLTVFRFVGEQIKEAIMSKKIKKTKFGIRTVKRCKKRLAAISPHFFESVWAVGASVAAAMVISSSTH